MENRKHILMVMPVMHGGGAERVASLLLNEFQRLGHKCECLLTNDVPEMVVENDLSPDVSLLFLQNFQKAIGGLAGLRYTLMRWYSTLFCRLFELLSLSVPAHFAYCSFVSQYYSQIQALHDYLKARPNATVFTFLQPSIPMLMLAARGLPNRVVFSERGGSAKLIMSKRYGFKFISKYYARADAVVFQTPDAQAAYPSNISVKGKLISNPIKPNLPLPYKGERRKVINTFCRISREKNLPLLLEAFLQVHKKHLDYQLHVIGDALNPDGEAILIKLKQYVTSHCLEQIVSFLPFSANVHQEILADAMFINCSDYEGMSNSMLEAMAIGLPTICTDCPIGGAHQTITDHENGLLVSVGNAQALANAMCEIIENPELAQRLSANGTRIRDKLNVKTIAGYWLDLL